MSDIEKYNSVGDALVQIRQIVRQSRKQIAQSVNEVLLHTYWEIGQVIVEQEQYGNTKAEYGKALIRSLSKELTRELGKGFSRSNLFNMRNFYLAYPKFQTVSGKLGWSHYCELLSISDAEKRSFYEQECLRSNWSVRELKRQIKTSLFERLLLSEGKANKEKVLQLSKEGQTIQEPDDVLKEPYVFEFLALPEKKAVLEKDLHQKLLQHLAEFLSAITFLLPAMCRIFLIRRYLSNRWSGCFRKRRTKQDRDFIYAGLFIHLRCTVSIVVDDAFLPTPHLSLAEARGYSHTQVLRT